MKRKWVVRVVLASPSDVEKERDAVERAIAHLNFLLKASDAPAFLELWRYEKDTHPGLRPRGPQELIESLLKIKESDVLVAIFGRRFGTPVEGAGSGTASEIQRAVESWRSNGHPEIMLYFKNPHLEGVEEDDQLVATQAFKQNLLATVRPLVHEYDSGPTDFELLVGNHLWVFVQKLLAKVGESDLKPISFKVLPAEPVLIRREGITERVGDLFLECRYEAATSPVSPPWFSVMIAFPVPVTSRLQRGYASYAGPRLVEIGRRGQKADFHATGISATGNIIVFAPVWLDGIEPHETRTFQISNIRCNASAIVADELKGVVSVNGAVVEHGLQVVAKMATGLRFEVRDSAGSDGFCGLHSDTTCWSRAMSDRNPAVHPGVPTCV